MKKCAVGVKIVNRTLFYVLSFLTAHKSHQKTMLLRLFFFTLPIRFFIICSVQKELFKCKNFIAVNYNNSSLKKFPSLSGSGSK